MLPIKDRYFNYLRQQNISNNTYKNYKSDLNEFEEFIKNALRESGLDINNLNEAIPHLDYKLSEEYKQHLINKNDSISSINRNLSSLRKFSKYVYEIGIIPADFTRELTNISNLIPFSDNTNSLLNSYQAYLVSKKASRNTIKNYLSDTRQFLNSLINTDFTSLSSDDIKKYFLTDLKYVPLVSLDRKLSSLKNFFEWLKENGKVKNNPVSDYAKERAMLFPKISLVKKDVEAKSNLKARIIALFAGNKGAQKLLHDLFYTRPEWYRKYQIGSLARLFNLGLIIALAVSLGIGIYEQLFAKTQVPLAYPAAVRTPKRYLSFQGRLLDQYSTPVSNTKSVTFRLYNSDTGGSASWNGTCNIEPDEDGIFSVLLGSDCGTEIDSSVFSDNSQIWLGITIDGDTEASPRVQIATVGYALNSETVQGVPITATRSATKNSIVTMNNDGWIVLGETGPKMTSLSGTFAIEGQALTLQTASGTGGDINIAPDSTGSVNITSSAQSDDTIYITNAQQTTGALIHGYYGGSETSTDLIRLGSGTTETDKFWVKSDGTSYLAGNLGIGSATPTAGVDTPSLRIRGGLFDTNNSVGTSGQILSTTEAGVDWVDMPSGLSGSGTKNYLPKWSGLSSLGNSLIFDDGVNVGIGTETPSNALEINGDITLSSGGNRWIGIGSTSSLVRPGDLTIEAGAPALGAGNTLYLYGGNAGGGYGDVGIKGGSVNFTLGSLGDHYVTLNATGLGIGTTSPQQSFETTGGIRMGPLITGAGSLDPVYRDVNGDLVTPASSIRYKYDVNDYEDVLEKIKNLKIVRFKWNENTSTPNQSDFGLIAEDVNSIFPELVTYEADGITPHGLRYEKMGVYALKGIQEEDKKISDIKNSIENLNLNSDGEIIINKLSDNNYEVKDAVSGNTFDKIAAFGKFFAGNVSSGFTISKDLIIENSATFLGTMKAGVLEAEEITSNGIVTVQGTMDNLLVKAGLSSPTIQTSMISPLVNENDISIKIGNSDSSGFGRLMVKNPEGIEVASIDEAGNATFSGSLKADKTVSNEIKANTIYADQIISRYGKFEDLSASEISGITREEVESMLKDAEVDQKTMLEAMEWNKNTASQSANIKALITQTNDLFVTNQAAINSLSVSTSFTLGGDMVIASDTSSGGSTNSINSLTMPLSLQSLALAPMEIMAGKVKINTFGDVEIAGNLYVAGRIESKGITIKENNNSPNGDAGSKLLSLQDEKGTEVASINSSGLANLTQISADSLIIASSDTSTQSANLSGVIESNATAGHAVLGANKDEVTISNPKITDGTLIYITPTTSTQNNVLYVKAKGTGSADLGTVGFFKVGFNNALDTDVEFNWWIVEIKKKDQ